jgi:hypothetical protein
MILRRESFVKWLRGRGRRGSRRKGRYRVIIGRGWLGRMRP